MTEPRWIDKRALLTLHDECVAEHGGLLGIRDEGLFDSALGRPPNQFAYAGVSDVCELASAHAFGIAKNHPFADGNKRAAFIAAGLFLALNKNRLEADQNDAVQAMYRLAAGELDETGFAQWLRTNSRPR